MSAQVTTALRLSVPDTQPLSVHEPHLTLRAPADDVRVTIDLDGEAPDALAEALAQIQWGDA